MVTETPEKVPTRQFEAGLPGSWVVTALDGRRFVRCPCFDAVVEVKKEEGEGLLFFFLGCQMIWLSDGVR